VAEIGRVGLETEEEAVVAEAGDGVDLHLVQIGPHVAGTVGVPGVLADGGSAFVIPVQVAVPGPVRSAAVGDRPGIRLLVPVVAGHEAHEGGVDEAGELLVIVVDEGAALHRGRVVLAEIEPGEAVLHPVERPAGKEVVEIDLVELEEAHGLGGLGVVVVVVDVVGVEEYPLAVLVVPDLDDLVDDHVDHARLPAVGHAHPAEEVVEGEAVAARPGVLDAVEDGDAVPAGEFREGGRVPPPPGDVIEEPHLGLELGARPCDDLVEVLALAEFPELRPVPFLPFPFHGGVSDGIVLHLHDADVVVQGDALEELGGDVYGFNNGADKGITRGELGPDLDVAAVKVGAPDLEGKLRPAPDEAVFLPVVREGLGRHATAEEVLDLRALGDIGAHGQLHGADLAHGNDEVVGAALPEVDDRGGEPAAVNVTVEAEADGILGAVFAERAEGALLPGLAAVGGLEGGLADMGRVAAALLEFLSPGDEDRPALFLVLRLGAGKLQDILSLLQPLGGEFTPAVPFAVVPGVPGGNRAFIAVDRECKRVLPRLVIRKDYHPGRFRPRILEGEDFPGAVRAPDIVGVDALFAVAGAGGVVLDELHVEERHAAAGMLHEPVHETGVVDEFGVPAPGCGDGPGGISGWDGEKQEAGYQRYCSSHGGVLFPGWTGSVFAVS